MPRFASRVARLAALGLAAGALTSVVSQPSQAALPGLVAAWGFEEASGASALDASGLGLTGTLNGPTRVAAGRHGAGLSFDGTNDQVVVPHAAALALTNGMTLEAWVRPTTSSGWRTAVIKERPNGLAWALYASEGAGRPSSWISVGGSDRDATSTTALPLNTWTHVAATYNGTNQRLFVNGVQVATRAVTGNLATSTGALKIGGNNVWSEWFAGQIDEVRIYNRALSAAEITTDMNTPVGPGEGPPPDPTPADKGRWTGPVELGLVAVNMVYMHTGKVLMFGGEDHGGTTASVWDPATGQVRSVPAPYNIFCSGHSQLADGRILIVGGHDNAGGILGSEEAAIFDPVSETWTMVPPMSQRRWYPSATTLPDGRVIVTSGGKTDFDDIADIPEIYDPATNSWTQLTQAQLAFPYYPFSFVLPDGKLLIAGAGEHPATTRTLDVAARQWTTIDDRPIDGGSAAMYLPGKVIKTGTSATTDVNNVPSAATAYTLDMTAPNPQWQPTSPMAFRRAYHTLSMLPDGSVIVTGGGVTTEGKDVSAAVREAEIWSPTTGTWKTMAAMTVPRLYHGTALLLRDGRMAVAGSGDSYGGPDQTTAEFFEPPYLHQGGTRPTLTGVPTTVAHGAAFSATATGTISKVTLVRPAAVTHQFDEDTRYLSLPFTQTGDQLSVTAPANANLAPPGYYLMFAVDDRGVPSVGQWIRLPAAGADNVAPTAPVALTATGAFGRIDLDWGASTDAVGVTGYDVHRATTAGFTPTPANRIAQTTTATEYADASAVPGTTYHYLVRARDAAANLSPPSNGASAAALGDTNAPTVSITQPAAGATVSAAVTLAATATDDVGVTSVQFRVDGANVGAADTSSPYSLSWSSTSVANGAHQISAVARDAAGNTTTSAAVGVTVSNTAPPGPAGLVGAWSFDQAGTAPDASGTGNNGTINGATWTAAGKQGGALTFDGVNDRVAVPDAASLDLTNRMTLEAWVRPTTTVADWRTVLLKEHASGLSYALYGGDNTAPRPSAWLNIGGDKFVNGPSSLPGSTWVHLAVTYDGTTVRLYVGGTQVGHARPDRQHGGRHRRPLDRREHQVGRVVRRPDRRGAGLQHRPHRRPGRRRHDAAGRLGSVCADSSSRTIVYAADRAVRMMGWAESSTRMTLPAATCCGPGSAGARRPWVERAVRRARDRSAAATHAAPSAPARSRSPWRRRRGCASRRHRSPRAGRGPAPSWSHARYGLVRRTPRSPSLRASRGRIAGAARRRRCGSRG